MKNNILSPTLGIYYVNFILLMVMMLACFSFFASPVGYEVRMPTQENLNIITGPATVLRITGENVLYFNDKVVTINELKRILFKLGRVKFALEIQVDRRASMGRMADVWELCKGIGAARVKIRIL